jgi:hypothetical protein
VHLTLDITTMLLLLVLLISPTRADDTCGTMFIPDPIVFSHPGDVNLAYLSSMTMSDSLHGDCYGPWQTGDQLTSSYVYGDLLPFAVSRINADPGLLPNVTLGFTVLDTCMRWQVALARVWSLLQDRCHGVEVGVAEGKLVGVIGPVSSGYSVMLSPALTLHRIPHVALQATSDELSDKSR